MLGHTDLISVYGDILTGVEKSFSVLRGHRHRSVRLEIPLPCRDAPVRTALVVGRGIDPRTSRFSGARSTN